MADEGQQQNPQDEATPAEENKVLHWMRTVGGSSKLAAQREAKWKADAAAADDGRRKGERKEFHMKLFKTPKETLIAIALGSERKMQLSVDKFFFVALLAGGNTVPTLQLVRTYTLSQCLLGLGEYLPS